jgi:hypothetical protein
VRGPSSVLWGSDAGHGFVKERNRFENGFHADHRLPFRYASAENSFIERVDTVGDPLAYGRVGQGSRDAGDRCLHHLRTVRGGYDLRGFPPPPALVPNIRNRRQHMFDIRLGGIALATLATVITAQTRIIVVDAQNRPGTHFTTIQAAVATAAHGDLIAVRAGRYGPFATDQGVAVLAEPGTLVTGTAVPFAPAVRIDNLPAGRRFALQNVHLGDAVSMRGGVVATNCGGDILLENVVGRLPGTLNNVSLPLVAADGVGRIVLSRCHLIGTPAVSVARSWLLATDSNFLGADGFAGHGEIAAGIGIRAVDSNVVLSRCTLTGGNVGPAAGSFVSAQPAIDSLRSSWTITALPGAAITAGTEPGRAVSAIAGTGTVVLHPMIQLVPHGGAPPVAPGIALVRVPVPSLSAQGAAPGGWVHVDLFSAPGDVVVLAVGTPGSPTLLPGLGELWLDPARGIVIAAAGVQDQTARFRLAVPVPLSVQLLGAAFSWQGLSAPPAGPARLSNPATYVHGW